MRSRGDCGGLVFLGRGDLDLPGREGAIERLPAVSFGGGDEALPDDSSGRLSHVRVEYTAGALCAEHTLAAVTFAAAGSGTQVDRNRR